MVKIEVDFWTTGFHGEEFGIKQKEQWMAKSRQFTRDMDIFGAIKIDGESSGLIAYRENALKEDNRLVIRAFTKGGAWIGSLEELLAKEIRNTALLDAPTLSYAIILSKYDYIVTIEKIIKPGLFKKETYVFDIFNEKKEIETFAIISDRMSLGADFSVVRTKDDKKVASLDSKVLNIGGRIDIKYHDKSIENNIALRNILILFAASLRFVEEQKDKVMHLVRKLRKDKEFVLEIADEELALYKNPRRIKY